MDNFGAGIVLWMLAISSALGTGLLWGAAIGCFVFAAFCLLFFAAWAAND